MRPQAHLIVGFAVAVAACHGRETGRSEAGILPDPSAHQPGAQGTQAQTAGGDADSDPMKRLQHACDGGDADACIIVGEAYETGRGVVESFGRALDVYGRACTGGSAEACRRLGGMYAEGRGVAASPTRSRELWTTACDGGDGEACAELAQLYATGKGVHADRKKAASLYARACAGGVTAACGEVQRMRSARVGP